MAWRPRRKWVGWASDGRGWDRCSLRYKHKRDLFRMFAMMRFLSPEMRFKWKQVIAFRTTQRLRAGVDIELRSERSDGDDSDRCEYSGDVIVVSDSE